MEFKCQANILWQKLIILIEDNENKKPTCYIKTCASYKTCLKSHENPPKVPNTSPHKLYQLFSAVLDPRLRFQQLSCSSPSSQLGDGVRGSHGGELDQQLVVEQEHEQLVAARGGEAGPGQNKATQHKVFMPGREHAIHPRGGKPRSAGYGGGVQERWGEGERGGGVQERAEERVLSS